MPPTVIFLSAVDFPYGLAAPYRIRMFAKAFQSLGYTTLGVWQYAPGVATAGQNTQVEGEYDGIRFWYPLGTIEPPKSAGTMLKYKTLGLRAVRRKVEELARSHQVLYFFAYGTTGLEDAYYQRMARDLGAKFITEVCDSPELALIGRPKGLLGGLKHRLKHRLLMMKESYIARSDYVFVIGQGLFQHYARSMPAERLLITPILSDISRFPEPTPRTGGGPLRLWWSGSFRPEQGLEFLVEALAHLKTRLPQFQAEVVGYTPKHQAYADSIQQRINAAGLQAEVKLVPAIPNDQLPQRIQTADILLLPKEDNEVNRNNFPTKLVDYLMAGRPVVSSKVGEVLEYFVDGENLLYSAQNTPAAFAEAIIQLANDPVCAAQIGLGGRALAARHFDYRGVGQAIGEFLPAPAKRGSE